MLGNGLPSPSALLTVDGFDFGESRASTDTDFRMGPAPEKGLCGELGDKTLSELENLLIRSLMLLARCRFDLQDRPTGLL